MQTRFDCKPGKVAQLCIVAILICRSSFAEKPEEGNWIPADAETFLNRLIEKDLSLLDSRVRLSRFETITRSQEAEYLRRVFQYRRSGRTPPRRDSPEFADLKPVRIATHSNYDMKLAEGVLSMTRTSDHNSQGEKLARPLIFTATETPRGCHIEFDGPGPQTKLTDTPPLRRGSLNDSRMEIEFVLGVGFGSRIQEIQSITAQQDLAVVEATMNLWGDDTTRAVLEVDRNFLVRKAGLHANRNGHETQIFVSCTGTINGPKGSSYSSAGRYRRVALASLNKQGKKQMHSVVDQFITSDHDVELFKLGAELLLNPMFQNKSNR